MTDNCIGNQPAEGDEDRSCSDNQLREVVVDQALGDEEADEGSHDGDDLGGSDVWRLHALSIG